MSSTQTNGKKSGSGSNSTVNTPASTPVTSISNMQNGQSATQTSPPPNNNAPKYGTLVPNRIFVGGISANTTEGELHQLFSNYGTVKAAKIIQDRAGVSKGYGFITFESEDDAKRLQREADNIVLRERKLNIAPAIKKQPFSRAYEASSPTTVTAGNAPQYYFQTGVPYFQGGMAYYPPTAAPGDPTTQQPAVYQPQSVYPPQSGPPQATTYPPVMFSPQPVYMPQPYPMPMPQYDYNYYAGNGGSQFIMGSQGGPQSQVPPMQRPSSPPRPHCYGQQLSYSTDPVYYPVYTAMEGPPVYQDSLDIANGTIPEESYQFGDYIPQELRSPLIHKTNVQIESTGNSTKINQTDTARQSNTPVVSLLSIDHQQEKDLTSMQSGRRRRSPSQTPRACTPDNHNFVTNGFGYPNSNTYPPPNMYVTHLPCMTPHVEYGYHSNAVTHKYPNNRNLTNGYDKMHNNIRKKRIYGNERQQQSFNTDNATTVRSDSNSSASVVDENRNENKLSLTENNTQQQQQHHSLSSPMGTSSYSGHKFHNNTVRPNWVAYRSGYQDKRSNKTFPTKKVYNSNNNTSHKENNAENVYNKNNNITLKNNVPASENLNGVDLPKTTPHPYVPVPQIHPVSSQHFAPPSRRNRKTVRRNATAVSEIGAGDAPLPVQDVADTGKKLESLKL